MTDKPTKSPEQKARIVVNLIRSGDIDPFLDDIANALSRRRKTKGHELLDLIQPGDEGQLTNIRPKYLSGTAVRFIERRNTKLVVRLLEPAGRFLEGEQLIISPQCWRYN